MSGTARVERDGNVATITLDNPPVNAFSHAMRVALLAAVEQVDGEAGVEAVVVIGAGRNFAAGADLRELDGPQREPILTDVLSRLEACGKPVVAALAGATLGGGAEAALACHYRCAAGDLQFGFPEVTLGLLPGAGGTVRLPRLVGWRRAFELMSTGKPLGIEAALESGLVDRRIDGDLRAGAVAWARELAATRASPRRVAELPAPPARPAEFEEMLRALPAPARRLPAPPRIVEALACASLLPPDAALARARALFLECVATPESRAHRHLFFAERHVPVDLSAARPAARAAVLGAGTMGAGIATTLVTAGLDVTLFDARAEAIDAGVARIEANLAAAARKGRLDEAGVRAARARLSVAATVEAAASNADLVIEAVFEDLAVKKSLFEALGRAAKPGAVLATNTSTLDVDAIAAASGRPADVVGMHFFSPAHVMRLVEVVRGAASSADALATAFAVARRAGKIGVLVGNGFGFVGNRMLYAYGREKELLMLEGATPEAVDQALQDFGMAMGPNAVGDLAGLDIGYHARRQWAGRPDDARFYRVSDLLAEQGRLGQKSGRGFYRYGPGGERLPDPEVHALIRAEAGKLGIARRPIGAEEIVERCILALVNEGARVLGEGIATSGADVDVIWCNGYGFPRHRGGPMFHADLLGLRAVVGSIRRLAATHGERYWTPAPLLVTLAEGGGSLAGWRGAAGAATGTGGR